MTATLTEYEITVLDKFVPTQTFQDLNSTRVAMRNYVREQREGVRTQEGEEAFEAFANRTVDHIAHFLVENSFFHDRNGEVIVITEKGKHLREQGSLKKYLAWEEQRNAVLINEMHIIEKTGYLKREQPTPAELHEHKMSEQRKSYLIYYVLILVALAAFYFIGKYHKFN